MTVPCFADRLISTIRTKKSVVIVGLDPHSDQIAELYSTESLQDTVSFAAAVRRFCLDILEAVHDLVPAVKVQLAFFERLGPHGLAVLEEVVDVAQKKGLLVIADAKRGDIGSTASAYAAYHLGPIPGQEDGYLGGLGADAVTVNPYFGADTLDVFAPYLKQGKGVWIVLRTTNPGAALLQDVTVSLSDSHSGSHQPLYEYVADTLLKNYQGLRGQYGYSSVGLVVSVTDQEAVRRLRRRFPAVFFLIPGVETQGATLEETRLCFNHEGLGAIVSFSRSLLFAYRDAAWGKSRSCWCDAARWKTQRMVDSLTHLVRHS